MLISSLYLIDVGRMRLQTANGLAIMWYKGRCSALSIILWLIVIQSRGRNKIWKTAVYLKQLNFQCFRKSLLQPSNKVTDSDRAFTE